MKQVIFCLCFALAPLVSGATISFTNEAIFLSNLNSFVTHNFDSFDPGVVFSDGTVLTNQIAGMSFENSHVTLGDNGGTSESPSNVVLNSDLVSPIIITFDNAVRGVGLFNTSLVDAERFDVFDAQNNLLGSLNLPSSVVNFGGFISDEGIKKVVITPITPTNGSIFIDTLTVSSTSVPEPSTYFLLLSALAIGLFSRKK